MEARLVENLKSTFLHSGISFSGIEVVRGRIIVRTRSERAEEAASRVFGVKSASHAVEVPAEMEAIEKAARAVAREGEGSFAVRARRLTKDLPINSQEIARIVGAAIREETGRPVDLSNPDQVIGIEVIGGRAYVFDSRVEGPGGLPLGTQGTAVALISGGIDSPVAAWLMMRRGVEILPLHMKVGDRSEESFYRVLRVLREYSRGGERDPTVLDHAETMTQVTSALAEVGELSWTCLFCKRAMLKAAEEVARARGAEAIVTGESLGQVASQTLANMSVISRGLELPVLRPLIGMDKEEIVSVAKRIGTYQVYERPPPCPFRPKRVITSARWDKFVEVARKSGLHHLLSP